MTKWLRMSQSDYEYLEGQAVDADMVFKSPNVVLKHALRMDVTEHKKRPTKQHGLSEDSGKKVKIRIDDDVWVRLCLEAERHKVNIFPMGELINLVKQSEPPQERLSDLRESSDISKKWEVLGVGGHEHEKTDESKRPATLRRTTRRPLTEA